MASLLDSWVVKALAMLVGVLGGVKVIVDFFWLLPVDAGNVVLWVRGLILAGVVIVVGLICFGAWMHDKLKKRGERRG